MPHLIRRFFAMQVTMKYKKLNVTTIFKRQSDCLDNTFIVSAFSILRFSLLFFIFFFTHFRVTNFTVHTCSRDPQSLYSEKNILKMGLMVLFIHLKIILLQCFQFSTK